MAVGGSLGDIGKRIADLWKEHGSQHHDQAETWPPQQPRNRTASLLEASRGEEGGIRRNFPSTKRRAARSAKALLLCFMAGIL